MFGLFYTLGIGIATIISGTKSFVENSNSLSGGIKRYKNGNNPKKTYYDRLGIERDINTNKIAGNTIDYDSLCDDEWLYVGTRTNRIRNLSEEKRAEEFYKGKQKDWFGRTADLYDRRFWSTNKGNPDKVEIVGAFYKDLNNGKLYVCREFVFHFNKRFVGNCEILDTRTCKFYMDIKTAKLVRKADTQIENENTIKNPFERYLTDKEAEDFISDFNKQQDNGGWYQNNIEKTNNPLKARQYFYCNKYNENDHVYTLYYLQNN